MLPTATYVMRTACLSLVILAGSRAESAAQVTLGGAVIAAQTPGDYESGLHLLPHDETEPGVIAFLGGFLSPTIGLQGEVSVPRRASSTYTSSHPGGDITDTAVRRDVLLSGLLRVRVTAWCHLLMGGGVAVISTSTSQTYQDRFSGGGFTTQTTLPDTVRPVLTAGADFPIRLARHVWLLPTARIHYIWRRDIESPPYISYPLGPPGNVSIRFGAGLMVGF